MVETNTIIFAVLFVIFIYFAARYLAKSDMPIDNKRRSFSFDEKAAVVEENVKRYGSRQCEKCGAKDNLSVDHRKPLARGGHNRIDNLQLLCRKCNSKKGDRYID